MQKPPAPKARVVFYGFSLHTRKTPRATAAVKVPVIRPAISRIGKYVIGAVLFIKHTAIKICPML